MTNFFQKEKIIKDLFPENLSSEARYKKIIELGFKLPIMDAKDLCEENLITGCQSLLYLSHALENGKLYFNAHSDALISKGLAALMIQLYHGESPETILKHPPTVLNEVHILTSISPNRLMGLNSLYKKIQSHALKAISK